jgi:hypothetical protein
MWDLLIILVLLTLGYGFGSYREKKHYQSIYEREAELNDIMVFESRFCPQPQQHLGGELVHGNVAFASTFELEPKICKGFPLVVGVHSDVPSVRA